MDSDTGEGKSKTTSVLLAVFLSFWTWLYTFKKDAWKFWVGLVIFIFAFILDINREWPLFLWIFGSGLWLWAIIDVAVKKNEWYRSYIRKQPSSSVPLKQTTTQPASLSAPQADSSAKSEKQNRSGCRQASTAFGILIVVGFFIFVLVMVSNPSDSGCGGPAPTPGAQVWDLRNDVGDVATVIVQPFTNSGTFGETSDSPGWFIRIPGLNPIRLHVGGNIVHDSGGDRWVFVGFTAPNTGGAKVMFQGRGEGRANGQFPNATRVTGTTTATIITPMGTTTGTSNWVGTRR